MEPPKPTREHVEAKILTVVNRNPRGMNRAVFDLSRPGAYRFTMDVSPDGKTGTPFLEGTYRKEG